MKQLTAELADLEALVATARDVVAMVATVPPPRVATRVLHPVVATADMVAHPRVPPAHLMVVLPAHLTVVPPAHPAVLPAHLMVARPAAPRDRPSVAHAVVSLEATVPPPRAATAGPQAAGPMFLNKETIFNRSEGILHLHLDLDHGQRLPGSALWRRLGASALGAAEWLRRRQRACAKQVGTWERR